MKVAATLYLGAGLVAAQASITALVGQLPTCAVGPLIAAIQKSGCGVTAYTCQCAPSNKAKIQAAATPEITSKCSGSEISDTLKITGEICSMALSGSGSSGGSSTTSAAATMSSSSSSSSGSSGSSGSSANTAKITTLVGELPTCATAPLIAAIQKSGCGVTDYACQCSTANHAKIQQAATPTITAKCSGAEISQTLKITGEICQLALGGSSSSGTSSAAGGSTPSPTTGGGSTPSPSGSAYPTIPQNKLNQIYTILGEIPSCGLTCLTKGAGESGTGCSVTDYACQCNLKNNAEIKKSVVPCLFHGCNYQASNFSSTLVKINNLTNKLCSLANPAYGPALSASEAAVAAATAAAGSVQVNKHYLEGAALLAAAAFAL